MEREVAALWAEYHQSGSQNAFDRLTLHYAPLIKFAAARLGDGSELAMRTGLESLRGAIEAYDHNGDGFEGYLLGKIANNVEVDVPVW